MTAGSVVQVGGANAAPGLPGGGLPLAPYCSSTSSLSALIREA
ncbi:MAG TPA: hypothetical protein VK817_18685 [Trebonia sp.]|nr:hypothetical protein [Trebonia sp.]